MALGQMIRRRRRYLNLTQEQLADRIGCARVTIANWERGATKCIEAAYITALEKVLSFENGELQNAFKTEYFKGA